MRPVVHDSSKTLPLGCFPRYGTAEIFIDFTEELRRTETDPTCKIHESLCTPRQHSRPKKSSLGVICSSDPHQRNTNAPKFEDRSQEGWQERFARETWRLAKNILSEKGNMKKHFFTSKVGLRRNVQTATLQTLPAWRSELPFSRWNRMHPLRRWTQSWLVGQSR